MPYAETMKLSVSAKELREKLSELLNTAMYGKQDIIIQRHNKPQAVLMDYDKYEWLTNPRLRYAQKEWDKGFDILDQIWSRAKPMTKKEFEEFEKVVDEEVHAVRREKRQAPKSSP